MILYSLQPAQNDSKAKVRVLMESDTQKLIIVNSDDVPTEVWDKARREAQSYSVGILAIRVINNHEKAQLIGTGTLVKYKTAVGILTAKHVVQGKTFRECTSIGLVFENTRHFNISKSECQVRYLNDPSTCNLDVALIIVYSNNMGWITARQLFINVENHIQAKIDQEFQGNKWFVLLFGFPEEKSKNIDPFKGFKTSLKFLGLSYFSTICGTEQHNLHDVLLVQVDLNKQHRIMAPEGIGRDEILPRDFGGISGGGLWKVILTTNQKSEMNYKKIAFEGIAYYQTEIVDNRCDIKCTSVRGIWETVVKILQEYSY